MLWLGGGTGGLPPTGGAATGGASDLPVPCNGTPCATGEICCHKGSDAAGDVCDADGSCSGGAKPVSCAGPAWCPSGEVCCATLGGNDGVEVVECRRTCDGDNDAVMCEGDPTDCGPDFTCTPSELLGSGYATCVGL